MSEPNAAAPTEALLSEAVSCAQRIREIIDEEKWPKDDLWVPTIRAHATVIHDNATAVASETAQLRAQVEMLTEELAKFFDAAQSAK